MSAIELGRAEFRDKVYACWMGKNIGGTLGAPYETQRFVHGLTFYRPVPEEALPNDDLDLQLVWLKLLEDVGPDPSVADLARYWGQHAASYPWNEYGFFMRNYARGLRPPVAGAFENYYVDEMGSPIRSEIWACLHPADPQAAARMAWKDSTLDHAGGEGMWGEMFWAAVESAAFVLRDPTALIRLGLDMIPLASHVGRAVREAVWCFEHGKEWGEARERLATMFGHVSPCNAVPNHGFTVIGWLYGDSFGDRLCKAVNCGYDTDCTGATLGSVLGILEGTAGIPAEWVQPIGDRIVVHKFTRNFTPPATIGELTDRTVALAERAVEGKGFVTFADRTRVGPEAAGLLTRNELAVAARGCDLNMGVELADGAEVEFHYGGEPVLRPGAPRQVSVTVDGAAPAGEVELAVPEGWRCDRLGPASFRLAADGEVEVAGRNEVTVTLPGGRSVPFTLLGPDEARGFPAGANVKKCPKCAARIEACICPD